MKKAHAAKSKNRTEPPQDAPKRADRDRRVRQSSRLARLLRVLSLIQSRGRWNAATIAKELECSERTVYRDLGVLEFAGVPWFYDETELCYRVRSDYRFPSLMLSDDESLGQAVATAITRAPGLDIGLGAGPTTQRLAASASKRVTQVLSDAARLIEVFDLKLVDHSKHSEIIKALQYALLKKQQISGNYESPYELATAKVTLHPYRLCLVKNAWYVIGHIDREAEPKTFRVNRFMTLRAIDRPAAIPADFDLRKYFGNAWSVYRGSISYDVELHFEPLAGRVVTETIWHPTQRSKTHKNGSVTLLFKVDGLDEILNWVLMWSGKVEVIQPLELKRKLVESLKAALKANGFS